MISCVAYVGRVGTAANIAGLPNEQIGYIASEEYASRMNSPATTAVHHKAHSNHSQTHVESPLRKASFPVDDDGKAAFDEATKTHRTAPPRSDSALESETDEDEIHVDAPAFRTSKYTGNGYDPPTEDLGPFGGNTDAEGGWIQETGYGVPILASDEVAKEPGSEYLQPAVSPVQERRGSTHYAGIDADVPLSYQSGYRNHSRPDSASNSRPSSRPGSIHGSLPGLTRFMSHDEREEMHTPLEDVDEYEPLFPEDEGKGSGSSATSDKKKRLEILKRRFPSQDIWEDTPNSLQLQATVETPEPIHEEEASALFENPETEAKRQGKNDGGEQNMPLAKDQPLAKSNWKPHLREEMNKPELKRRFPSQDIWEDSPDSAHLETTVEEPQSEEVKGEEARIPSDEGANAGEAADPGERLDKSIGESAGDEGLVTEGVTGPKASVSQKAVASETAGKSTDAGDQAVPAVPARPARRPHPAPPANITSDSPKSFTDSTSPTDSKQESASETRKVPMMPDRPKPQIPARPPRHAPRDASDMIPLSKSTSASSTGSGGAKGLELQGLMAPPPPPKSKPTIPSRPMGSKIASLKAGFLSDLDKRLQTGPQAPPKTSEKIVTAEPEKKEEEEEKAPLVDARKGRAKGPPRRKPAIVAAVAAAAAATATATAPPAIAAAEEEEEKKKGEEDVVKQYRSRLVMQEPWTVWQTEDDGTISAFHAAGNVHAPMRKGNDAGSEARSPAEPVPSSDSISGRDTPTSSRDENVVATFDDLPPSAASGTVESLKGGDLSAPAPALLGGSDKKVEHVGDEEAAQSSSGQGNPAQKPPVDFNVGKYEEGIISIVDEGEASIGMI